MKTIVNFPKITKNGVMQRSLDILILAHFILTQTVLT